MSHVAPLPSRSVFEHDYFVLQIFDLDARIGIGELAAARQFDEQEHAGALEQQPPATDDLFAVAHCLPSGAVDGVPKPPDVGVSGAPLRFERLYFLIRESIRLEL